jgi:hypothetical protein
MITTRNGRPISHSDYPWPIILGKQNVRGTVTPLSAQPSSRKRAHLDSNRSTAIRGLPNNQSQTDGRRRDNSFAPSRGDRPVRSSASRLVHIPSHPHRKEAGLILRLPPGPHLIHPPNTAPIYTGPALRIRIAPICALRFCSHSLRSELGLGCARVAPRFGAVHRRRRLRFHGLGSSPRERKEAVAGRDRSDGEEEGGRPAGVPRPLAARGRPLLQPRHARRVLPHQRQQG